MNNSKRWSLLLAGMVAVNIGTASYIWLYIKHERFMAAVAAGRGSLNVLDYGAACDGVTDDSSAFNSAMEDAASMAVSLVIPGRTCLINSQLVIRSGTVMRAEGAVLKHGRGSGRLLAAISADDWVINGPLTLVGNRSDHLHEGDETGLFVSGANRYMVDKLTVRNFAGTGIEITGGKPSRAGQGDAGKFAFISLINNHIGLSLLPEKKYSAEYNLFTLVSFSGNDVAARIVSGNNIISAANIVGNTNGLLLESGLNHGHGIMNAVNINHNSGYDIKADGVTQGYTFTGCHAYGANGHIVLENSKDIDFSGCVLDPPLPAAK